MLKTQRWLFWVTLGATAGCSESAVGVDTSCVDLSAGQLVITEIFANPEGADDDLEFFELHNPTSAAVNIVGATLSVASKDEPTNTRTHDVGALSISAGDYVVLGNSAADPLPAHLDYTYGQDLGSLRNAAASISVLCGPTVVDSATYTTAPSGRTLQFNGSIPPDDAQNDDETLWCEAPDTAEDFLAGNIGTPGTANVACSNLPAGETCLANAVARDVVSPGPGDVEITEWMANPDGSDAELEWLELRANAAFDLNALQLGTDALRPPLGGSTCVPVAAGAHIVLGKSDMAAPVVDATLEFSIGNSNAQTLVVGADDTVFETVMYTGSAEGVSWQVDDAGALCLTDATELLNEYATDNFGTPGAPNMICPPMVGPSECLENGVPRTIVNPMAGELLVTEWMPNPDGADAQLEWVELRADATFDLNAVQFGEDAESLSEFVDSVDCVTLTTGELVVLGNSNMATPGVDFVLDVGLGNTGDHAVAVGVGGVIVDSVMYSGSQSGQSWQVDSMGVQCCTPDEVAHEYSTDNYGTPGEDNLVCAAPGC